MKEKFSIKLNKILGNRLNVLFTREKLCTKFTINALHMQRKLSTKSKNNVYIEHSAYEWKVIIYIEEERLHVTYWHENKDMSWIGKERLLRTYSRWKKSYQLNWKRFVYIKRTVHDGKGTNSLLFDSFWVASPVPLSSLV